MRTDAYIRRTFMNGFIVGVSCTVAALGVVFGYFFVQWYSLIHRQ